MKTFEVPELEVIYFRKADIIAASCRCVDCGDCGYGKDNCGRVDDL